MLRLIIQIYPKILKGKAEQIASGGYSFCSEQALQMDFLGSRQSLFIKLAAYPAPKPLSMLTTVTLAAQELSIASRVVSPPRFAPYPTLVGTAITGLSTRPPTTEGSAPSMPATTTSTRAERKTHSPPGGRGSAPRPPPPPRRASPRCPRRPPRSCPCRAAAAPRGPARAGAPPRRAAPRGATRAPIFR